MNQRLHQCPVILAAFVAVNVFVHASRLAGDTSAPSFREAGDLGLSKPSVQGLRKQDQDAQHWAYRPIRQPIVPGSGKANGSLSPIDAFIIEKLESNNLTLSPPADPRVLIRRAYIDLVGLAPSYEEIEEFVADSSRDAFAKVVDRLLASPAYGERWGRHWLDVARFAETKDLVLLYGKDRLQPYAYTYRDYVIRALNLDTPYDRFVQEQIAADQIEPKVESWRLAALGFLTVGRLFDENPHDQIDDQIDTVTRGFLGLTVSCARCHNHKYDAIPTEDYYSLYGVFASSEKPYDLPLLEDPHNVTGGLEFERALAKARRELQGHIDSQYELLTETARSHIADYLVRIATTKLDLSETSSFFLSLSPEDLRPGLVLRWRRYLEQPARQEDPVFRLWAELMNLPDADFGVRAKAVLDQCLASAPDLNGLVADVFRNVTVTSKAHVAQTYGAVLEAVYARYRRPSGALTLVPPSDDECQLLATLESKESPFYFPRSSTHHHMSRVERDQFGKLVRELDKMAAYATNAPPARAMVVNDAELYDPRVFVRGSPARPGKPVPRQFLQVLSGQERQPFARGSGRLELAQAITAPDNPLTGRILVNRVWMHHFGEPLVSSPSDFGTRSDPPTHPELLDYLAWKFMQDGWSLKKLHRIIMLSSVYQQSSLDRPECRKIDPDNRWLWRAHRRRLDFESMRDTMLAVSGRLHGIMGGRSVDIAGDPLNGRRTIYGLVDRQDLPGMFRAFDFACPDQSVERRPRTIVPQQALFAMNSAFAMEQARALANRAEHKLDLAGWRDEEGSCGHPKSLTSLDGKQTQQLVAGVYQAVLGRGPKPAEAVRAVDFMEVAEVGCSEEREQQLSALAQFAQVLLMSNEFLFVD